MSRDLIIVRGLPGSGKSTLAKLFASRAICTADDYHTDKNGNYNWKPENVGKSHEWCQRKCRRFMENKVPLILIANTSTSEREMKPYMDLAIKYGYRTSSIVVENRHGGQNVHGVPEETMNKMEERLKNNIKLRQLIHMTISKVEYWEYYPTKHKKEIINCVDLGETELLGPLRKKGDAFLKKEPHHIFVDKDNNYIIIPTRDIISY